MQRYLWFIVGLLLAGSASAQTGEPRVTVFAGAAFQSGTLSFSDVTTFPYFAETARLEGSYDVRDGTAIDVGGGVRIWRGFGAGVSVTTLKRRTATDVSGAYPHPFFFNRDRRNAWPYDGLQLQETGIHVSAMYVAPVGSRFAIALFGGPTFFSFKQGVVNDVNVNEAYPYDSIDASLVKGRINGSTIGFHAGGDVTWYFTRNIGVGALARVTTGKKNTRIGEGEPFDLKLGGVQGGGGVRLRF